MTVRILTGDCRELMATLPEASVDAIVTDPPYELGFMGKGWDKSGVANDVRTWREALRVLKPGGHLLAFSGTRTYHRMVCAIEDAGFEIRDQIQWVYSSGFPKSHNLDNLRGESICGCESTPQRDVRSVHNADIPKARGAGEERGQVLQQGVPEQGAPIDEVQRAAAPEGAGQSSLEGWGDLPQAARELRLGPVRSGTGVGDAHGEGRRVLDGAPTGDGAVVRLPADAAGGGPSRGSRPAAQRAAELGTVAGQPKPQARGAWQVCGGCGLPILPRGLGTALKPSNEPIVVARKPLVGTVAENVLQHGTGALNIDGCRVAGESTRRTNHAEMGYHGGNLSSQYQTGSDAGRWPANLIHDGSEEVVALFPREAGAQAPVTVRNGDKFRGTYGAFKGNRDEAGSSFQGDSGSAARFFYTPKADAADRNEGLPQGRKNTHPTVKPTDLMRYLCRLVTPPGGTVLDPFCGSGSTLKGAELEGFDAIGMDLDPAHVDIARYRVAGDAPLFAEVSA